MKLLDEADSQGMTSIAIPAIGTGNLGYPGHVTANVMFEAVAEFSQRRRRSTLQNIHFWVYDKDSATIQVRNIICASLL